MGEMVNIDDLNSQDTYVISQSSRNRVIKQIKQPTNSMYILENTQIKFACACTCVFVLRSYYYPLEGISGLLAVNVKLTKLNLQIECPSYHLTS